MASVHVCDGMICLRDFKREFSDEREGHPGCDWEGTVVFRVQEDLRHMCHLEGLSFFLKGQKG